MTSYTIDFPEVGTVKVHKKRGMKSIRLRVNPGGEVVVSAPSHISKSVIHDFINRRTDWIKTHTEDYSLNIRDEMKFGDGLTLHIKDLATRNNSRIIGTNLYVNVAGTLDTTATAQYKYIETKMIAAMQHEAEVILLPRLYELSKQTDHTFNQAYVKRLSSRWGSCDQSKNITLNIFLLQLPLELQEYVMLHELTHTIHMNHSKVFWDHMKKFIPEVARLKKEIKIHHPRIEERI